MSTPLNPARRQYLNWAAGSALLGCGVPAYAQTCLADSAETRLLVDTGLLWNFTRSHYRAHLDMLYTDQLVISNSVEVAIGRASSKSRLRPTLALEDGWQTRVQMNVALLQKNIYCSNLSLIFIADVDAGPTYEIASFILSAALAPQLELSVIAPCYANRNSAFAAVATIRDLARDDLVGQWASLPLVVNSCSCSAPSIEYN